MSQITLMNFFTSDQLPAYSIGIATCLWQRLSTCTQRKTWSLLAQTASHRTRTFVCSSSQTCENGPVIGVKRQIVFGDAEQIEARLAASKLRHTINTRIKERNNRTLREHNRRFDQKTTGFSKELLGLEKQLWLSLAYYHLCLPHTSLREALPNPESDQRCGSHQKWRKVTPAMAAGITDHVWTISELLGYRVPASFFNTIDKIKHLFP